MRLRCRYLLAFLLTAAVCLSAVLLPSRLVAWWDEQAWFGSVHGVDVSQSNVSYSYALTTAERLDLLTEYMRLEEDSQTNSSISALPDLSPAENEISADQALSISLEEARELTSLGLLPPVDWDELQTRSASYQEKSSNLVSLEFIRLMDWNNPQRKLSLWIISLHLISETSYYSVETDDTALFFLDSFNCIMDAETGKLYLLSCSSTMVDSDPEFSLEQFYETLNLSAWADYLGVTAPELSPYTPSEPEFEVDEYTQIQQLTFSQEDPAFQYFFSSQSYPFSYSGYSHDLAWTHLALTPIWPA